jgi:hypothetical protein
MLNSLRFQNFKSWKDTGEMRIAPITGFFGPNSSGKTAILQFLLLLKQTVESSDRNRILHLGDDRTYVDLGTTYDIIYRHELPQKLKYSISLDQGTLKALSVFQFAPIFSLLEVNSVFPSLRKFSSIIKIDQDRLIVEEFRFQYELKDYSKNSGSSKTTCISSKYVRGETTSRLESFFLDEEIQPVAFGEPLLFKNEPKILKNYGFSDTVIPSDFVASDISESSKGSLFLIPECIAAYENLFQSIYYLGPLRDYPKRTYLWSGERPQDVGKRGELAAAALLASSSDNSDPETTVEFAVAKWLKQLGLIHRFQVRPIAPNRRDYEIVVQRSPHAPEVLITDVGFGISQILPVLVLCYYVPEGSTVMFEQPELHLHPSVQSGLADLFIEVTQTRNLQIILESHSEHLLQRLQRRIAEEKILPEQAALYFCSLNSDGDSHLTALELDSFGNITNYPTGFFGDEMGDLVAMTEAAMKRQMPGSVA